MSRMVRQPVAVACVFTWIGCLAAISFMEAWLKFRAPGVTLPVGLGIGRLVFSALNKMEWALAMIAIISALVYARNYRAVSNIGLGAAVLILVVQSAWLLPALDARALLYIQGKPVPDSALHLCFMVAELFKVMALLITGAALFERK